MPIYCFSCCGNKVEVIQGMNQKPPVCPTCGNPMTMMFSAPAIISVKHDGVRARSKGYKDDYAKNYRRRLQDAKS